MHRRWLLCLLLLSCSLATWYADDDYMKEVNRRYNYAYMTSYTQWYDREIPLLLLSIADVLGNRVAHQHLTRNLHGLMYNFCDIQVHMKPGWFEVYLSSAYKSGAFEWRLGWWINRVIICHSFKYDLFIIFVDVYPMVLV